MVVVVLLLTLSHVWLLSDPMGCSCQAPLSMGLILQARIVEWIAISLSRGSSRLNLHLLHWQVDSLPLSHQESPRMAVVPINFANLDKLHNLSCCCSVAQSCPTLCHPMDCSMPGVPVLHHLPEPAQTHVHWVGDAIQPYRPLPSPSLPAFYLS